MAALELTPETQVSAVVAAYPGTLRMFEALGIDYCCGGKRTLREAATSAGMPVERVLAVLQMSIAQAGAVTVERNWQEATLDELIDHIVRTHHAYMYRELPRLDEMLGKVVRAHGLHHGNILEPLRATFAELRADIEDHLRKEEELTFPAIRRLLGGQYDEEVRRGIAELQDEHEHAGALLARMREITGNYVTPADACTTYCALYDGLQALERDLHQHIHLENNILFPRVQQLVAQQRPAA